MSTFVQSMPAPSSQWAPHLGPIAQAPHQSGHLMSEVMLCGHAVANLGWIFHLATFCIHVHQAGANKQVRRTPEQHTMPWFRLIQRAGFGRRGTMAHWICKEMSCSSTQAGLISVFPDTCPFFFPVFRIPACLIL